MRRSILFAALSVLGLAAVASADDSWTLWMMGAASPWDSVGTFPSKEECVAALRQQAQAVQKVGLKVSEDVTTASFAAADVDRDMRGQCLPQASGPPAK
ncbi:MAG TPA: hypothetical protein VJX92_25975 [Methylomirabilota bacterium]|nr:hypothetical protein [Methylomirabilota bacterium]